MLVDVRSYRCRPGTINAHLALYEEYGLAPQYRCLGTPLAFCAARAAIQTNMSIYGSMKMPVTVKPNGQSCGLIRTGWPMSRKVLNLARLNARKTSLWSRPAFALI